MSGTSSAASSNVSTPLHRRRESSPVRLPKIYPEYGDDEVGKELSALSRRLHLSPDSPVPRSQTPSHSSLDRRVSRDILEQRNELGPKLVIFMVGLPARGKSYICKKLARYLTWCGFTTKIFNVGNRRRTHACAHSPEISPAALPPPAAPLHTSDTSHTVQLPIIIEPTPTRPLLNKHLAHLQKERLSGTTSPVVLPLPSATAGTQHDATFFDPQNETARELRDRLALETLEEVFVWLRNGLGRVAIHDATNSTVERRRAVLERALKEKYVHALFVESICDDGAVLEQNIQMKLRGPDYINMAPDEAIRDFKARIKAYERAYQTIGDEEEKRGVSYIKIIDVGRKIIAHNIHGYLPSQCVFYLMQMNIKERHIYLTRHGQSVYNVYDRIGGDPPLTELGDKYGQALTRFMESRHPLPNETDSNHNGIRHEDARENGQEYGREHGNGVRPLERVVDGNFGTQAHPVSLSIWTSCLRRTIDTTAYFDERYDIKHVKALNEIYAGLCENMTYDEIEKNYPGEATARKQNKLMYRYPGSGGESYLDVIERLRTIIIELERMETDALIVCHNVVMRTILAYFWGVPLDQMPNLDVPLHTLYCLKPKPYGADLVKYKYNEQTDEFEADGTSL
ncbi:hypothetical protein SeMB42_g03412 [Synchytrium endobioticum]|uniref:6-phosphofructo-2-kinase domain-containing protein n=1 Tax=Synchytrium endobioticum TaxID=286115 RepID=A0A507CW87_9FUNG|nr:hypothetical protein SeLEV6574_g05227 [Synchytrium endobioticum]TPX47243.1 hypothetical protein SeMB42_g03412 [Synchytrium endobioticum]